MTNTSSQIVKLRKETSAPIMACRDALDESKGDYDKALKILKSKSAEWAVEKKERDTKEGIIEGYIHATKKIGVLVELTCETDFVAKNPEFQTLAHDIAMQVAATNPKYISTKDAGKNAKAEDCLMHQEFFKDPSLKISNLVDEKIAKFGENIQVKKFIRFELGA